MKKKERIEYYNGQKVVILEDGDFLFGKELELYEKLEKKRLERPFIKRLFIKDKLLYIFSKKHRNYINELQKELEALKRN